MKIKFHHLPDKFRKPSQLAEMTEIKKAQEAQYFHAKKRAELSRKSRHQKPARSVFDLLWRRKS